MSRLPPEAAASVTEWLGDGWTARALAGDASVRAYYRITAADGRTYILAYYPEEVRAQLGRFLGAYDAIVPHAPLPEVLQHCQLAVLQHDVGERTLYDVLHEDRAEGVRLYRIAIDLLAGFQRAGDAGLNAPFTAKVFFAELQMAREYYVEQLMDSAGEPLQPYLKKISENLERHPYRLCHRDFHGQNLHIFDEMVYLIDYQDLRMGPDLYDMASLLRDRGIGRILGDEMELELIAYYGEAAGVEGDVRRRYFETLLQRSIKILGTFSKQPIVRGKLHYLDFIPPTLESIGRCLEELPEFAPLRDIFPLQFDPDAARERARVLNTELEQNG